MFTIKLIVTGQMEKHSLHDSLRKFFPPQKDGHDVVWERPQLSNCATSHRLVVGAAPNNPMRALAKAMFAAAIDGKTGAPADLVLVIDDVELGNVGQEGVVAAHFRQAVSQLLNDYNANTRTRYEGILREKCSFHLLKPMVESYLFGDATALTTVGVPAERTPKLVHPSDLEQFETNDPAWLPTCATENAKQQVTKPWWKHECHPKRYLEHLTEDAESMYEETDHGKRALSSLRWDETLKQPADLPIVRALFQDIADWFGVQNPLGQTMSPDHNFYPAPNVRRATLLLRNM